MLAGVEREDPLADSVIKPDAAAIKRRRLRAKTWRAHEESTTEPERVSHTPRGGGVALAARIALIPFSSPTKAYPFGKAPERLGRCTHFGTVRPGGNSILAAKARQRRKGLSARQASSASAYAGVHCGTIGAERLVLLVQGAKMVQSELPSGTSLCRLPPGPARSLRAVPGEPRPHDPRGSGGNAGPAEGAIPLRRAGDPGRATFGSIPGSARW